jgi:hypothetical protein
MIRFSTRWCVLGFMVCAAASSPAFAQRVVRPQLQPASLITSNLAGELYGTIEDDNGHPLAGAVVSALGATTVFAVTDRDGRFSFRGLPAGPYLVRAHLQGYTPARGRVIQVSPGGRAAHTFALVRNTEPSETPTILTAGTGGVVQAPPSDGDKHEHGEVAWRLRHQKRSVLKDAQQAVADLGGDDSLFGDSFSGLGRAVEGSARLASSLFSDLSFGGHLNLLTSTSFDRPQDLFAMTAEALRGVAYVSIVVPGANGDWLMRGTVTQGDISSWIATGAYRRSPDAVHAYEAGLSYSAQRYLGGNGEALLAMRDGSRNVGAVYAYDNWAIVPQVRLGYGARYARYDYLPDESLDSPRASVTVRPAD